MEKHKHDFAKSYINVLKVTEEKVKGSEDFLNTPYVRVKQGTVSSSTVLILGFVSDTFIYMTPVRDHRKSGLVNV